ncbi:MAG: hypothetical protein EG826_05425, partial [Deltaproteobacteria bacterium]|nr:hypothetical protein [Deltaproteobacteria bacterium]
MFRVRPVVAFLMLLTFISLPAQAAHQVNFVSEIGVDNPFHAAADKNGSLYVTGYKGGLLAGKNGFVYVFSPEGKNILTFSGQTKNGEPYLQKPSGIAVYGDHIYVADKSLDSVAIFSKTGVCRDAFGESGSGPKQFSSPEGIFVYQGIIYVADTGNDRIQVLGQNGVFLRSIGNTGKEESLLKSPTAVAVDSKGLIYAVDGAARIVKMYRQDGTYVGKLAGPVKPFSLAIADDGLFVTDVEKYNVTKYTFTGEKLFSFGTMGPGKVQFQELYGIATDSLGNVYAVDRSRATIQVIATGKGAGNDLPFDISPPTSVKWLRDIPLAAKKLAWDKTSRSTFAVDGDSDAIHTIKDGRVEKTIRVPDAVPVSVAVDLKGFLWIIDREASQLVKLDAAGRVLLKVGSSGNKEGYFSKPSDILIGPDGLIYVADKNNNRIQVFNGEGVLMNTFAKAAGNQPLETPVAIAQDAKGNTYALCEDRKIVVCIAPNGSVTREIGGDLAGADKFESPVGLAVMGPELLVADAGTRSVKVFTLAGKFLREFGSRGNGRGEFKQPASIVAMDGGSFMVADPGNKRVQTFGMQYTPSPPAGIQAKPDMRAVDLSWNPSEEGVVEAYRVFRKLEGDFSYQEVGTSPKHSFRDVSVLPGKKYVYRVSARGAGGNENIATESASAVPLKYTPPPPIGLEAQSQEWSVDLVWKMRKEDYIDHYNIYRDGDGSALIARTKTGAFSEGGLEPDTSYTYLVSAVSIDEVESEHVPVSIRTQVAIKAPLEIDILEMSDIFSNTYKIYENEGIGKVRLTNNTRNPIATLKLAFNIKEYMDFPTEAEIRNLQPKESREVAFKAVFNNKILEVTEDTPVQTELKVSYYENQKLRSYSKNNALRLYEKHRMMWVNKDRVATFITSKDPVVLEFTRAVVTQYADISSPLVYAGALYEYLGFMGMTYLHHPNNPYQIVEGKTRIVDYVQYPRETLKRNSGVCTDLVVLYTAALEGLGIRTMILGTPDHLFMMFAVGEVSDLGDSTMNGLLVVHEGTVWAPVELTLVGSPFMKAWETGSKTYYEWKNKGIELTDLARAWDRYKPATLPFSDWRVSVKNKSEVNKRYGDEIAKLHRIWLKHTSNRYYMATMKDPEDAHAFIQLGIIYGEAGELETAQSF